LSRKQLFVTNFLKWTGVHRLIKTLPPRPSLIVVNYHRVGDASGCEFDRNSFGASADQLDQQIRILSRLGPIVDLTEALYLMRHPEKMKRLNVLLTFDDGYLDNYEIAFPVLRANGCSAVFFVVGQMVGSSVVPWWDEISYLIRNSGITALDLPAPWNTRVELGSDREGAIAAALRFYKSDENTDSAQFLEELRRQTGIHVPEQPQRFMGWAELREMIQNGMDIGSHTVTHPILSQISEEEQLRELVESKKVIEANTGARVRALAYPVGSRSAFTRTTMRLALEAGYEAAFSFFGGVNIPPSCEMTNIRRLAPWTADDASIFTTEMDLMAHLGPAMSRLADRRSAMRNY